MRTLTLRRLLHRTRLDTRGSVLVEFAILAPAFIMLMIGILQVGVYVQNYNAIRTLAADVSRYAMIEYQKGNKITDEAIEAQTPSIANSSGANLDASRLVVGVDKKPTSTIANMTEMTITVSYDSPEFLPFLDSLVSMSYSRPVFLFDG